MDTIRPIEKFQKLALNYTLKKNDEKIISLQLWAKMDFKKNPFSIKESVSSIHDEGNSLELHSELHAN